MLSSRVATTAGGADVEQVARHQRPVALHFHQALPAVRQGQLEQDLEIVRQAFLDRQHLGLARLAFAQQAGQGLHQLQGHLGVGLGVALRLRRRQRARGGNRG